MNRKREKSRTLTGSRIYIRRGKYQYFSPEPLINPKTGKATKWIILCAVDEGELKARNILDALLGKIESDQGQGDFSIWFPIYKTSVAKKRIKDAPTDPARAKIWETGGKAQMSVLGVIEKGFADFNLLQITPADVATFIDNWEGRRSAQSYRTQLTKFFAWATRKGLINSNPAREVTVIKPPPRDVYITDEQYVSIHNALLIGKNGRKTPSGKMIQCYMDLLYLLHQRGTEIRLLKWSDIQSGGIFFKPTKTERSSAAKVLVPIGPEVEKVIARLRAIRKMRSVYLIHTQHGQPYTAHGIGSAFERAAARAGVTGVTLKDIRAKAATDASGQGYTDEQIKTALAHADTSTTRSYIRTRAVPVSEVVLTLPKGTAT